LEIVKAVFISSLFLNDYIFFSYFRNASLDSSNENFIIWYIELSPELKDDAIWSFLIGILSLPERQKVKMI